MSEIAHVVFSYDGGELVFEKDDFLFTSHLVEGLVFNYSGKEFEVVKIVTPAGIPGRRPSKKTVFVVPC